ncbi:MAG: carbohydrate-binding domain-containing protein [Nanoarchaeota archaeon]
MGARNAEDERILARNDHFIYWLIILLLIFAVIGSNVYFISKFKNLNTDLDHARNALNNKTFELNEVITVLNSTQADIDFYGEIYERNKEEIGVLQTGKAFIYDKDRGLYARYCVKLVEDVPESNFLVINASGSYAGEDWPQMLVNVDYRLITKITVSSANYTLYSIPANLSKGVHNIDLLFINDYYKEESVNGKQTIFDRNLFISNIIIGNKSISYAESTTDAGRNRQAFDCVSTQKGKNVLFGAGAMRFSVLVE